MPSLTSTEKENNNSLLRVENGAVWADKASAIIGTHNQIKEDKTILPSMGAQSGQQERVAILLYR